MRHCTHVFRKLLYSHNQGVVLTRSKSCAHTFKELYSHIQGVVLPHSKSCTHTFKELYSHIQGVVLTQSGNFTNTFKELYSYVQGVTILIYSRCCTHMFKELLTILTHSRSCTHMFKELQYSYIQGVVLTCSRSCSGALDRWQSMYSINRHSLVIGRGIIVTSWLLGMSMADINVLARYVNTCCLELSDSE